MAGCVVREAARSATRIGNGGDGAERGESGASEDMEEGCTFEGREPEERTGRDARVQGGDGASEEAMR